MNAKTIADTIREQLGRGMFFMIGTYDLTYNKDGALSFCFKMCKKFNHCTIALNFMDTYDVTFRKITTKVRRVKKSMGIFISTNCTNFSSG